MINLLVIDDEPWIRKGIIAKLKKSHLKFNNIYEASNGLEAISIMEKDDPTIVITDIVMPKINGLELIEYANNNLPDIYFIIISGYSEFDYAQKAINLGAKGYILKPISEKKLLSIIDNIMEESQALENQGRPNYEVDMITKVKRHIIGNYSRNITVKSIAEHFSINPNYLSSLFSTEVGETITQYLTKIRIEEACHILIRSDEPIYSISYKVGYGDSQYFHRVFKRIKGKTPSDFRDEHRVATLNKEEENLIKYRAVLKG